MKRYFEILDYILTDGEYKDNRTGIGTYTVSGVKFQHYMSKGFPLLTTKNVPFHLVASELEFFIKGLTDKKWLQDRNNHIWDEWCNPQRVPYGHDEETKQKMLKERDLGSIYGWQWRNFGANYQGYKSDYSSQGIDQLEMLVNTLKVNPNDRRMVVSAWNPIDLDKMALPPCHFQFQVVVIGDKLNLLWSQRSVDSVLGLPFNIASYGLLLHLLAKEGGFKEGKLTGFLGDTHIYDNHINGLKKQLERDPYELPTVETDNFNSIFDWKYTDSEVKNYKHHPRIKFEIAV